MAICHEGSNVISDCLNTSKVCSLVSIYQHPRLFNCLCPHRQKQKDPFSYVNLYILFYILLGFSSGCFPTNTIHKVNEEKRMQAFEYIIHDTPATG